MGDYMDYIRKKQTEAFNDGVDVEDLFVITALNSGNYVSAFKTEGNQDRDEHWDRGLIDEDGNKTLFDVKGIKRFWIDNFEEKKLSDQYHTIELLAVDGVLGWSYGKADYIAFEFEDKFICVNRKKLGKYAMIMCAGSLKTAEYYLSIIKTDTNTLSRIEKIRRKNELNKLHGVLTRPGDFIYGGKTLIEEKLYKRYRRKKRHDLTVDVKKEDIEKLKDFEIFKDSVA